MKCRMFFFIALLTSIQSYSQDQFQGLYGWVDKDGGLHYEYRGVQAAVFVVDGNISDQRTIDQIQNNYALGKIVRVVNEDAENSILGKRYVVVEAQYSDKNEVMVYKTAYLFQSMDETVDLILFASHNPRSQSLEQTLIEAYYKGNLASYMEEYNQVANKIKIGTEEVSLSNYYYWLEPNRVGMGLRYEFSWSVFSTLEDATLDSENRIARDQSSQLKSSIDEFIDIKFLNKSTVARVVTYYPPDNTMPFDRYYIVNKFDSSYVSCELTNLIRFDGDRSLAQGIKQIISFDDGVGFTDWLTKADWKELGTRSGIKYEIEQPIDDDGYEHLPSIELGVGSYIPLGNLYSVIGAAPGICFYFSWPPLIGNFTMDFGSGLYYSTKGKKYFQSENITYQLYSFVPLYTRCKYQFRIAKYFYITPYVGGGVHFALVDINDGDDSYSDSSISSDFKCPLAAVGGFNFRYKNYAIFAEYNFVNYNWEKDLGRSYSKWALNLGFAYNFNM